MYSERIRIYVFMYVCIYIATHLFMVCRHWLHLVLESNLRWAWRWRSSELRDVLDGHDRGYFEMLFKAEIEWTLTWKWMLRSWELEMLVEVEIEWINQCDCMLWSNKVGEELTYWDCANLEDMIERVWECNRRPRLSKLSDVIGCPDPVSVQMHLGASIHWTQRWNWMPWSSDSGDTHGCRDGVTSEMQLEDVIEPAPWWTWRPRSSELRDALVDRNQARLEI